MEAGGESPEAARARAALASGTDALGLDLPRGAEERLLSFLAELRRWNRAYNLVADAPVPVWATSHLLDSLSVAARLRDLVSGGNRSAPARVLDLGTGAGLPGIPLAIALPELRFVLLDGNGKKVRFCRHAVAAPGLANVEVAEGRAERYVPSAPFDAAVVRAVGSLARIRALARPYCSGPVLAMKGRHPARELAELEGVPFEVAPLRVPGLEARHLVILR